MQSFPIQNNYRLFDISGPENEDISIGGVTIPNDLVLKWISKCKCTRGDVVGQLETLRDIGASTVLTRNIAAVDPAGAQEYPILFYRGDINLLNQPSVAVVGTRAPSPDGVKRAEKVASTLVEMGFGVMSGLAKGIDAVAHETALKLGGKTIAVLGTPINEIYPAANKGLAERIVASGNIVLSPAMPYEHTGNYLFPRRNRLMAQLAEATVVIEVGSTSGVVHQAAECLRKRKKLLFLKSIAESEHAKWVGNFIRSGAQIINKADDLREVLRG